MSTSKTPVPASKRTRRQRAELSWAKCAPVTLRDFVALCTDNGCAVLFGRTMDGGALMCQILSGNERYKEYITVYADVVPVLAQMLEDAIDTDAANTLELATKED